MKIPVVTGDGRLINLDSEDYGRLVVMPEACADIPPELWEMFAEPTQSDAKLRATSTATTSATAVTTPAVISRRLAT